MKDSACKSFGFCKHIYENHIQSVKNNTIPSSDFSVNQNIPSSDFSVNQANITLMLNPSISRNGLCPDLSSMSGNQLFTKDKYNFHSDAIYT